MDQILLSKKEVWQGTEQQMKSNIDAILKQVELKQEEYDRIFQDNQLLDEKLSKANDQIEKLQKALKEKLETKEKLELDKLKMQRDIGEQKEDIK